jgi:predicted  nucleic acid-binding Zn-ribbon protein|tara:strand:+ start:578 stop:721 length:144 start_codon:yes stop_codon:yes gene_type:complete
MNFEELNNKLEQALDIIMEHFSETEDRISELEEELESLKNGISKVSR